MAAGHYIADTENGDHVDDPSEDSLFMLFTDLNTADPQATWWALVTLLDDGTYEVDRRHPGRPAGHSNQDF